jgi:uncharacterized membrane protein
MKRGWIVPALALLGLADALYLSVLHWQGEVPPCGGYGGCAQVNTSPFAETFGVPIAALGALLYAALLAIALGRRQLKGVVLAHATLLLYSLTLAGALFVAYLTGVEALVLHAYCYWCLLLAAITFLLLGLVTREVWLIGSPPAQYYVGRT